MINRTKIVQKIIDVNEKVIFYPQLKKFYKNKLLKEEVIVFDVGCNKGQSLDFFLKINKKCKFYAFEPNLDLFKNLTEKYKSNKNVKIYNMGISNTNGSLNFKQNVMHETSSFEDLNYNSPYLVRKAKILGVRKENLIVNEYKVEVTTLNSFINKNHINNIDVLKIDVEGHELKCLLGLFNNEFNDTHIRYIQLEKHNDDMYLNKGDALKISRLLEKKMYKEVACINHGFGGIQEVIYENCKI